MYALGDPLSPTLFDQGIFRKISWARGLGKLFFFFFSQFFHPLIFKGAKKKNFNKFYTGGASIFLLSHWGKGKKKGGAFYVGKIKLNWGGGTFSPVIFRVLDILPFGGLCCVPGGLRGFLPPILPRFCSFFIYFLKKFSRFLNGKGFSFDFPGGAKGGKSLNQKKEKVFCKQKPQPPK